MDWKKRLLSVGEFAGGLLVGVIVGGFGMAWLFVNYHYEAERKLHDLTRPTLNQRRLEHASVLNGSADIKLKLLERSYFYCKWLQLGEPELLKMMSSDTSVVLGSNRMFASDHRLNAGWLPTTAGQKIPILFLNNGSIGIGDETRLENVPDHSDHLVVISTIKGREYRVNDF